MSSFSKVEGQQRYCANKVIPVYGSLDVANDAKKNAVMAKVPLPLPEKHMVFDQVLDFVARHQQQFPRAYCHPQIAGFQEEDLREMGFGVRSLVRSFYEITILAAAAAAASPTKKLEMLIEVAEALRHLHEHHTVHGHLHPANIFYTKGGGAVVADPSLHMFSRPFMLDRVSLDSSSVYQPREALDATQTTLEASADVYAFSSIIYAVMTGNPPLKATSAESIKDSMCEITFFGHTRVSKPEDMLPKLWDIVQKCWSVNAAKRPSMQVVIDNLEMIYFYGFNSKEDEYDLSW